MKKKLIIAGIITFVLTAAGILTVRNRRVFRCAKYSHS